MAIAEAEKLNLTGNHFYHMLLGVLFIETDKELARQHFLKALAHARTPVDKQVIQHKIEEL
jgi:RNA polymerase sigma-70 factor (ECF subfamily)